MKRSYTYLFTIRRRWCVVDHIINFDRVNLFDRNISIGFEKWMVNIDQFIIKCLPIIIKCIYISCYCRISTLWLDLHADRMCMRQIWVIFKHLNVFYARSDAFLPKIGIICTVRWLSSNIQKKNWELAPVV